MHFNHAQDLTNLFCRRIATKKVSPPRRTSIISLEDLNEVKVHLVGGEVTCAISGTIYTIYAYTGKTFEVLKKEEYLQTLVKLKLKPLIDSLPWGVNLQAYAQFMASYDYKTKMGSLKTPREIFDR